MKKIRLLPVMLAAVLLTGCSFSQTDGNPASLSDAASVASADDDDSSGMFTARDKEVGYDEDTAAIIQLNGGSAVCDSDAVKISGGTVTITDEGTYILSGTLNGMIIVDADKTDKPQLVLKGAKITSDTSAALYVRQADKVFVTMAEGSENTLSNGGEYVDIDENSIDSVIFSKDDITFNGFGTMKINAGAGHGIVSKDDLAITSGAYEITSEAHGISANDSVRIADGDITVNSGKDGIQAENSDDASLGFIYAAGGKLDISCEGDGLSAGSYLKTDGGDFTITSGGGSANAETYVNERQGFFGGGSSSSDVSAKGIKADGNIEINGGDFDINSADDAIHSNANVDIKGGTFIISSGDDGIHADSTLSVLAGNIDITQSFEGIEGETVNISGGQISLCASDDGLNAAGGADESGYGGQFGRESFGGTGGEINISGGKLTIDSGGDGIDSNGDISISGGEIYVAGPENGSNGAIDYEGNAVISGGTLVAAGASQMAVNFGSDSTQGSMLVTFSGQQGGAITLSDSGSNVIVSWETDKYFDSAVISAPEIVSGGSYTLTAGNSQTNVTMQSLIYSDAPQMMQGRQQRMPNF